MNIAPALYELLRKDNTIKGVVKGRIYPDQIPQNVPYPALVHYKTNVGQTVVKSGPTENYKITWQVDIYSEKYGESATLAQAIKNLLDKYSGTVKGINIQGCYFQSQNDDKYIEQLQAYATQMQFLIRVVN